MIALVPPRFTSGQATALALAEGHIHERELVSRRRHLSPANHAPPGFKTQILHGEILRAHSFAETAQAAGIDQFVGLVIPHDDGFVVVYFPCVLFWISLKRLQISTDLDAFEAFTLNTPGDLGPGFGGRITSVRSEKRRGGLVGDAREAGVQTRFIRPVFFPSGGQGHLLKMTVDGSGTPSALGCLLHR